MKCCNYRYEWPKPYCQNSSFGIPKDRHLEIVEKKSIYYYLQAGLYVAAIRVNCSSQRTALRRWTFHYTNTHTYIRQASVDEEQITDHLRKERKFFYACRVSEVSFICERDVSKLWMRNSAVIGLPKFSPLFTNAHSSPQDYTFFVRFDAENVSWEQCFQKISKVGVKIIYMLHAFFHNFDIDFVKMNKRCMDINNISYNNRNKIKILYI